MVLGQGTRDSTESAAAPLPPQQSAEWKPLPSKLPKTLVSAAAHLFQLGLADPRGCEYREIEVLVGGFPPEWKDEVVKTHGWVIPAGQKQPQRFGVCWNGLVYPLSSVGKAVDLRADVREAATTEPFDYAGITGWYWSGTWESPCLCNPNEARAVHYASPLLIKACFLLRLGETEPAELLWNHWRHRKGLSGKEVESDPQHLKDPYAMLANCWALALYDRAWGAHLRGDDRFALAAAETLARVAPALKGEAARRGFSETALGHSMLAGPLDCFGILADQRRRAKERKENTAPFIAPTSIPNRRNSGTSSDRSTIDARAKRSGSPS